MSTTERQKVTELIRLHKDGLCNMELLFLTKFCFVSKIIKSRRMGWTCSFRVSVQKSVEFTWKTHLVSLDVFGMTTVKGILKKRVRLWIGLIWFSVLSIYEQLEKLKNPFEFRETLGIN